MATSAVSSVSSTETKYPVLINGYLCYSAAEVRAARQSINPRSLDPVTGQPAGSDRGGTATTATAATNSGQRSFLDTLRGYTAQGTRSDEDERMPRGSLLNILA